NLLSDPATIEIAMATPADVYKVDNRYGFEPGDVIIAAEPGQECALAEVTKTPDVPGEKNRIFHDTGTYADTEGNGMTARYNKPGGLGIAYSTAATLYNLGRGPQRNQYRIENNQLVLQRLLGALDTTVVAEQIVQLKAEYGKDDGSGGGTPNDGIVDGYSNDAPVDADGWRQVLAVRLAVVARSTQAEKPLVEGGACDITTAFPSWAGGELDVSADDNWQCYRYRVFETTVPLRNLIWMQI
ncbi:MAG: PilW family protein, partial [Burkholderiales bacterium]|nr:PilW family protein [Burkholderiales bacterium]